VTERDDNRDPHLELHLKAFGARFRAIRRSKDVTQDDLAERTGIARSHLSAMEHGTVNPSLGTLWRIARALDVHVADLLDDRER
jgi:transcriptional regulator with XRE-family HTH domain